MKKTFLIISAIMWMPAVWATCYEGTWITAHTADEEGCVVTEDGETETKVLCNGKQFCKSNVAMNWFSAWSWCKSQGMTLASISSMCPNRTSYGNTCQNLKGKGSSYVWSITAYNSSLALLVYLSSGAVNNGHRNYNLYALCE